MLDPREALRANRQESSKNGQTDGDSGDAAHKGQHNGFDQKLPQNARAGSS